jgi:hypothetical protein
MPIYEGTRYEKTAVYGYDHPTKGFRPTLDRRSLFKLPAGSEVIQHQWSQGDSIDYIAYLYLGDCSLWYIILDCNTQYMSPWDIKTGDILTIPTRDTVRRVLDAV